MNARLLSCGLGTAALALVMVLVAGAASGAPPEVHDLGAGQYAVVFSFDAPPPTRSVHLAGTFNGWSPSATAMQGPDDQGTFTVSLTLDAGRYEYKFVLDGQQWQTDPDNPTKTGPHDNAVLALGVPAMPIGPEPVSGVPRNMAALAPHPSVVNELATALRNADAVTAAALARAWLADHPMPLVGADTVSFLYADAQASSVGVLIRATGLWTAYDLARLGGGLPVFAATLRRDDFPGDSIYLFDVDEGGERRSVVDPFAWTVTSRDGQPVGVVAQGDPRRSRIRLLRDVKPSTSGLRSRDIYVYCPPGYEADTQQRFPVIYMHDGQNCWDDPQEPFGHGGWQVNVTADRLIAAGDVEPFLVVGICNTPDRLTEYGPGPDILSPTAHEYIEYLVRDVKPRIDATFRTQPGPADTALLGSSLGGCISLQAALLRPDVFGQAACLSPAFRFKDQAGRDYFDLLARVGKVPVRIYLDSGTAGPGGDGADATRRMGEALAAGGWVDHDGHRGDLMRCEDAGAEHNERAWRARLDRPLRFLKWAAPATQPIPRASGGV